MLLNRLGVRLCALVVVVWPAIAVAQASHVSIEIGDRGVTLDARNSTLREILDEWERVGGVRILNGDRLDQKRVTLQLTGVSEREAFQILLRDIGGFVLSARGIHEAGRSQFSSLIVVPANTQLYREPALVPPTATAAAATKQDVPIDDEPQETLEALVGGAPAKVRTPRFPPGTLNPALSSAAVDHGVEEAETTAGSLEEVPDAGTPSSVPPRDPVPPTPLLRPSEVRDPANPFGSKGAARPGTITPVGPPPGVVFATPTDPSQGQTQGTTTPR